MTILLTVLSGILVFIAGQILVKFVIDPIQEFYKVVGEVADELVYQANVYSNPDVCAPEVLDEVQKSLRRLSTKLFSRVHVIPVYGVWSFIKIVPPRKDVVRAGGLMIGLSNNLRKSASAGEENGRRRDAIQSLLKIETE